MLWMILWDGGPRGRCRGTWNSGGSFYGNGQQRPEGLAKTGPLAKLPGDLNRIVFEVKTTPE